MDTLKAVTIDFEDWYQGIEQPFDTWNRFEERIQASSDKVLSILDETDTRATFFVLGWIAEKYPSLVRDIAEAGHEIASHGYDHEKLYETKPDTFRRQLGRARKVTEDAIGRPVTGHRAPYFTITRKSLWAIDILEELGFLFDASIYPGINWRYGIPGTPGTLYMLNDTNVVEFPVSTFDIPGGRRVGIGGAYFRILPLFMTRRALQQRDALGLVSNLYLHPWEFDPGHPLVRFPWKAMATHYFNLWATAGRFRRLLHKEQFTSMGAVIDTARGMGEIPRIDVRQSTDHE